MKQLSKQQLIIVGGAALLVIALVALIGFNIRRAANKRPADFTLKIWGTDEPQVMSRVFEGYKSLRSGARLEYRQIDPQSYDNELLNALASGEGPDVFYIGNRSLPRQVSRIVPLDTAQFADLNPARFREIFPRAPEQDFILNGQIYALPLYLDTLALFYNRDIFDQAGIVSPPKTWSEFQDDVARLREVNPQGQIVRAAAALGATEKTVDAGVDALHLLMLQNGTKMTSDNNLGASFASENEANRGGPAAFDFYLQFANAGSPDYTWNDGQPGSLDSFAAGKTAMIVNYQSAVPVIKNKSPFLNFAVSSVPQSSPDAAVNYPRYHGLAVSKQSQVQFYAWEFAIYLTTNSDSGRIYVDASGRPPAQRALIGERMGDAALGVFAKQALTARSWYDPDDIQVDKIFNAAINNVLTGQLSSEAALRQAQDQVNLLFQH